MYSTELIGRQIRSDTKSQKGTRPLQPQRFTMPIRKKSQGRFRLSVKKIGEQSEKE